MKENSRNGEKKKAKSAISLGCKHWNEMALQLFAEKCAHCPNTKDGKEDYSQCKICPTRVNINALTEGKKIQLPNKVVLENPVSYRFRADKLNNRTIVFYQYRGKRPIFLLEQRRWWNMEQMPDGELALVKALKGKRVTLTIEVQEK